MPRLLCAGWLRRPSPLRFTAGCVRVSCLLVLLNPLVPPDALGAEVYFSPGGGIRQRLVQAIEASRRTIDIAVYNFTASELAEALYAAKARGVRIRILVDREKAEEGFVIRGLRRHGLPVRTLGVPEQSLMHHKFAVFDDRLVATGSYNWTNSAEHANYENLVVLDDPEAIVRFQREFQRLWRQAQG
ncbi:MAG TPA: phospholipase D family protein [Candidatus Methylomirabilis sp.]|nr:phospholipase D family protein [Candidatus Methylomirabilis sp.]